MHESETQGPSAHAHAEGRKKHDHGTYLDRMGMGVSALCLIHCMAMPVLLLLAPMLLVQFRDVHIHLILALLILPIGLLAFGSGFRRHKQKRVLILGSIGLIIVGLTPLVLEGFDISLTTVEELVFMIPGSALLIYAHFLNQRCHC